MARDAVIILDPCAHVPVCSQDLIQGHGVMEDSALGFLSLMSDLANPND